MDRLEYKTARDVEYTRVGHSLKIIARNALIGLIAAGGLLAYDTTQLYSYLSNIRKDSNINEICLAIEKNDTTKLKELQVQRTAIQKHIPEMMKRAKKSKNIQDISEVVAIGSFLYFLGGSVIASAKSFKKKQALEKELLNNN